MLILIVMFVCLGKCLMKRERAGKVYVDKVLTLQTQGPEFPEPTENKLGVLAVPPLGKQGQVDPWNSLASQPSPPGEFQAHETPCLKKRSST